MAIQLPWNNTTSYKKRKVVATSYYFMFVHKVTKFTKINTQPIPVWFCVTSLRYPIIPYDLQTMRGISFCQRKSASSSSTFRCRVVTITRLYLSRRLGFLLRICSRLWKWQGNTTQIKNSNTYIIDVQIYEHYASNQIQWLCFKTLNLNSYESV